MSADVTPDESAFQDRLDFALEAAAAARDLILEHFRSAELQVESKSDASPVTAADRGAEVLIRERLASDFGSDGILGEEFGEKPSDNGFRWILDPIDGTKSFVHGVPLFGTLIGVEYQGELVVGVSAFPALDEVVYARKGGGAWWKIGDHEPVKAACRSTPTLAEGTFCFTSNTRWKTLGRGETFERLCATAAITRGWGDCFGHMLVATGRSDVMVGPHLSPWDAAALVPILQEAGGHFIDWNGEASIYSGDGMSVTDALRDEILTIVAETTTPASQLS